MEEEEKTYKTLAKSLAILFVGSVGGILGTSALGVFASSYGAVAIGAALTGAASAGIIPLAVAGGAALAYLGAKLLPKIRKNRERNKKNKAKKAAKNQEKHLEQTMAPKLENANKMIQDLQEEVKNLQQKQQEQGVSNDQTVGQEYQNLQEVVKELKNELKQIQDQKQGINGTSLEDQLPELHQAINNIERRLHQLTLQKAPQQDVVSKPDQQTSTKINQNNKLAISLQLKEIEKLIKKLQEDIQKVSKSIRHYKAPGYETKSGSSKSQGANQSQQQPMAKKTMVAETIGAGGNKQTSTKIGANVDFKQFMKPTDLTLLKQLENKELQIKLKMKMNISIADKAQKTNTSKLSINRR